MLTRVSAYASLVLGVTGIAAVVSLWGALAGAGLGVLAVVCGWAALSERPHGRVRRVARVGVATGVTAVAAFVILAALVLALERF